MFRLLGTVPTTPSNDQLNAVVGLWHEEVSALSSRVALWPAALRAPQRARQLAGPLSLVRVSIDGSGVGL